mgnify:CR=1 FL=1|tara:strand:- start:18545 stop:19525 length:981 start_codon:yes stop_codon:yes gene_type:complete
MAEILRNVEKLVLSGLEIDARIPLSKIGKRIGKSQQQISYTINSLYKKEILSGFYSLIDYSKLNVLSFRVYFRVSYVNKEKFDELINYLVSEQHISWIATCGGRYDLICTFFTLNPSQFNKNLRNIMTKFPNQLQNYTVLTTIVIRFFGRKYLFEKSIVPEVIFGGDREPEKIDETDMKILNELSENARKSSVEIAEKLSLTSKSIIQRIKKLRKRKIIMSFKSLTNPRNMGYNSHLLLIKYHNISLEMENELISYLKAHPNVISAVKTLGEWDIEIELETKNPAERRKVEMEIRQKFALLIQQIESIPLYLSYKKNYFPRFLLES